MRCSFRSTWVVLGALGIATAVAACSSTDAVKAKAPDDGPDDSLPKPWYDTEASSDTSYLPMGTVAYDKTEIAWQQEGNRVPVDVYAPREGRAPVVLFLPGALVKKERYFWFGSVLASHGVAVAIVQPFGGFNRAIHATGTLASLRDEATKADSPLRGRLDLTRLVLAGHSQGALVQAYITDLASCPAGFCGPDAVAPAHVRGLLLLGFHNEDPDAEKTDAPMAARDIPWLLLTGSRDGLTTPDKATNTFERLLDRPIAKIEVEGMNHFQFTDYVVPKDDSALARDLEPTIGNRDARATAATYAVRFVQRTLLGADAPSHLGAAADPRVKLVAKDARVVTPNAGDWPRVGRALVFQPGLDGNAENTDVVATAEFQGATYLLVRNDAAGMALFRLKGGGVLEAVEFAPGVKNGFYGNAKLSGIAGALAVFKGKLYVGMTSGFQGSRRDSTSAELWAYDGATFVPVVSNRADADPTFEIESIEGCADNDGDTSARIRFKGAAWTPNQWRGAVVDNEGAGSGPSVVFEIVSNDATSLVVQKNELAQDGGKEFTTCEGLAPGQRLALREGLDEAGFGDPWNKALTAMAVWGDTLYVATGLNYERGAQLFKTTDGTHFEAVLGRSFFRTQPGGGPISSSITALHVSDVGGTAHLYVAANGTEEYGARLARIPPGGAPEWLADGSIDDDDVGIDEPGFGRKTWQFASLSTFNGRLWIGGFDSNGLEVFSLGRPAPPIADLRVEVGEGAALPRGFGDKQQIVANLTVLGDRLWVGTFVDARTNRALRDASGIALRSDGQRWQLATAHGFGQNAIGVTRFFRVGGDVYGVASRGALTNRNGYGGLRLYRLGEEAAE